MPDFFIPKIILLGFQLWRSLHHVFSLIKLNWMRNFWNKEAAFLLSSPVSHREATQVFCSILNNCKKTPYHLAWTEANLELPFFWEQESQGFSSLLSPQCLVFGCLSYYLKILSKTVLAFCFEAWFLIEIEQLAVELWIRLTCWHNTTTIKATGLFGEFKVSLWSIFIL